MGTLMPLSRGTSPHEVIARDGERVDRLFAIVSGGATWVFHDGIAYEIVEDAPGRRRASGHESLSAPMPATVIQVNVQKGAQVRRGDTLVLLEAMKMELPLRAPADGVVTAVHCQAGELVQPGSPLVEIGE
jgi:3-methylcrotonyl-CoA carboxylase alpha subunit